MYSKLFKEQGRDWRYLQNPLIHVIGKLKRHHWFYLIFMQVYKCQTFMNSNNLYFFSSVDIYLQAFRKLDHNIQNEQNKF